MIVNGATGIGAVHPHASQNSPKNARKWASTVAGVRQGQLYVWLETGGVESEQLVLVHTDSWGTIDKWCDKDTKFYSTTFAHRTQICLWLCIISVSDANPHIWKYSLTVTQISILYCKTFPFVCIILSYMLISHIFTVGLAVLSCNTQLLSLKTLNIYLFYVHFVGFDCFYNVLICKSLWIKTSAKLLNK